MDDPVQTRAPLPYVVKESNLRDPSFRIKLQAFLATSTYNEFDLHGDAVGASEMVYKESEVP
jgi:hypothetical protein